MGNSVNTTVTSICISNGLMARIDEFYKRHGFKSRSHFFSRAAELYMSKILHCGICEQPISGSHYCGDCLIKMMKESSNESH